jgi:spore germination cell wall hydrolase CwlJ-like protein
MGFGPDQVDRWEPYQFTAACRGWKAAHSAQKTASPTAAEFRAAVAKKVR